jgi:alpha-glucosidase (family GH31 glycosyl hydrolase)
MGLIIKKRSLLVVLGLLALFAIQNSSLYAIENENPQIVPAWVLHPWVWEDSLNTQGTALTLVNGYLERDIPVGAIMIDSPWSTAYNDYEWNLKKYPQPKIMVDSLHSMGIKVVVWITGCMNVKSKDVPVQKAPGYDIAKEKGYAVNGGRDFDWWKGTGIHIDCTNEEANNWWWSQLDKVFKDYSLDGIKADDSPYAFGENVWSSIGVLSNEEFSITYYNSLSRYVHSRKKNSALFARAYSHQTGAASNIEDITVGWSGDCSGSWRGLRLQIKDIYKSARIGYGASACEIGGYNKKYPDKFEFTRYAQFGSMCPIMVNGGANGALTNHLPWWQGEDVERIYRYFATLHNELLPYTFSNSVNSHLNGGAIIKNTSFKYKSHTLGNDIFIQAITSENNDIEVFLPKTGEKWIDYWTNKEYSAGSVVNGNYPLDKYPIFIKAGAIIPMFVENSVTGHGDKGSKGKQTVLIYPYEESEYLYHRPLGEGREYSDVKIEFDAEDGELEVESGKDDDYIFLVKASKKPDDVKDADSWEYDSAEKWIKIAKHGKSFKLEIEGASFDD